MKAARLCPRRTGGVDDRLVTRRLILSRLTHADARAMFAYRSLPDVCRYQSWKPGKAAEVLSFIKGLSTAKPFAPGAWFQFGIRLRDKGTLVGDCGVLVKGEDERQAEMGITIAPAHQGKGYATEAQLTLLDFLFEELGKHRVVGSADPRNAASIALMRRLGMRREAHHVESFWMDGGWTDDVIYAILDREWRERKKKVLRGKRVRPPAHG
jgi:RimJ/RimL family protein N-acetyltransferase